MSALPVCTQAAEHMPTWREPEVLDRLALALGAAQQHAVLASGLLQSQLVEGQALATGLRTAVDGWSPDCADCLDSAAGVHSNTPSHTPCVPQQ